MEASQALAVESFSYSWLPNKSFSLNNLSETSLRNSLDFSDESHNLTFNFPILETSHFLVPADEIFSQGHILAKFGVWSDKDVSFVPIPESNSPGHTIYCNIVDKWRKSSIAIMRVFLGIFRPFCWMKMSVRKKRAIAREARRVKSLENLPLQVSSSSSGHAGGWSVDSSVYEAILYCKRSFDK